MAARPTNRTTREAVLDALMADPEMMMRFGVAGVSGARGMASEVLAEMERRGHRFVPREDGHEEIAGALLVLAAELLSPGVASGETPATAEPDEPDEVGEPAATVSVLPDTLPHADVIDEHSELPDDDERVEIRCAKDLVRFLVVRCAHDWAGYFENLCQRPESLRIAGGREFHRQSKKMGWAFSREEIEDALFEVAKALHSDSPAGAEHAYYDDLHTAVARYLDEQGIREALTADEEAEHVGRAVQAMISGDRSGYRRALREWVQAARDAGSTGSSPAA